MKNTGDGRRVARVEKEVQSVISTFIIQRLQSELPGLVTIARVQIPADLRMARVYVSLLQSDDGLNFSQSDGDNVQNRAQKPSLEETGRKNKKTDPLEKTVQVLQSWAPEIQDEIGHKLKMKYLPKLTFFPDHSSEKILKIEKLIAKLGDGSSMNQDHDDDFFEDSDEDDSE